MYNEDNNNDDDLAQFFLQNRQDKSKLKTIPCTFQCLYVIWQSLWLPPFPSTSHTIHWGTLQTCTSYSCIINYRNTYRLYYHISYCLLLTIMYKAYANLTIKYIYNKNNYTSDINFGTYLLRWSILLLKLFNVSEIVILKYMVRLSILTLHVIFMHKQRPKLCQWFSCINKEGLSRAKFHVECTDHFSLMRIKIVQHIFFFIFVAKMC